MDRLSSVSPATSATCRFSRRMMPMLFVWVGAVVQITLAYTLVPPPSSLRTPALVRRLPTTSTSLSLASSSSTKSSDSSSSGFSLTKIFGKGAKESDQSKLSSHPSERPHISPLNSLLEHNRQQFLRGGSNVRPLPQHPDVVSGVLPNGLSYIILPNASPANRFEAHLQVFSGSADELEHQQGIAHLTEHVAYMGSRKRERLFGTGSQTNAYTDFHHTVFYAACPTLTPRGDRPMLPMALEALCDVMEAAVEPSRLEKERQAVLSEMTMVNTMEYRVECQILGTLHRENRLAKRFPIGKETLIRNWQRPDVLTWHRTHYRPDNVLLYVVGDLESDATAECIKEVFGRLSASQQAQLIEPEVAPEASRLADAVVGTGTVKALRSWHYPPVIHEWGAVEEKNGHHESPTDTDTEASDDEAPYDIHLQSKWPLDEPVVDRLEPVELRPGRMLRPHIYRHELLQSFSLHLFAKRPVEPMVDIDSFRLSLAKRVALAALQIRLNVGGRSSEAPPFTFVEFNQMDSSREGCAVCSLDMTAEPERWREATMAALKELRRLGVHGVTPNEFERYAGALWTDAAQLAADGRRIGHGDQLAYLMEAVSNSHVVMDASQSLAATEEALQTMTLEEVNEQARRLCAHVLGFKEGSDSDDEFNDGTVVAVACCPIPTKTSPDDDIVEVDPCTAEALVETIYQACQVDVEPEEDVAVPQTLIPAEEIEEAMAKADEPPFWNGGSFTDGTPETSPDSITKPFTLRRLSNGIRVGVARRDDVESQRGHLRLVAPGGRDAEVRLGLKTGSMTVGARAMQEGGAFGPWTREQVELFCIDNLLMVEIACTEEALVMDFVFPTVPAIANNNPGSGNEPLSGTEAVLQIVREIIVGFVWEEDALGRSAQSFRAAHQGLLKNLEGRSTELVMEAMTSGDPRFLSIDVATVDSITLDDAKTAVMSQLQVPDLEISVAGDFADPLEVLELLRRYLGTIPADVNAQYLKNLKTDTKPASTPFGAVPPLPLPARRLDLELSDSDPRAIAYVAGAAPNQWGIMADGTSVAELVMENDTKQSDYDKSRRSHPLFARCALLLISEIVNRRLFSNVREKRQLTYDANFSLAAFERLAGGWFLVTVTASVDKADQALEACVETLQSLAGVSNDSVFSPQKIHGDNLESARRVVLNRHQGDLRTGRYWAADLISGTQCETIPSKGPLSVTDFERMIEAITVTDLQMVLDLGFGPMTEDRLYRTVGKTVLPEGLELNEKDLVVPAPAPVIGMRRGGALQG